MKEYFSHDYGARLDRKLVNLQMKYGMEGLGIYWCLIETLYENGGVIPLSDVERIAFELRTQCERITNVLRDFELFKFRDDFFYSESVNNRLLQRKKKSDSARFSANSRWERAETQQDNANAMRTHKKRNAIKVNNSKEKEKKEYKKERFTPPSDWIEIWKSWTDYKHEIKDRYVSLKSESMAFNKLVKLSSSDKQLATLIINQSIENQWKGLFEFKGIYKETSKDDFSEFRKHLAR